MVDEQHAVEMIDLVLERSGEQAVGLDLVFPALAVEIARLDEQIPRPLRAIRIDALEVAPVSWTVWRRR